VPHDHFAGIIKALEIKGVLYLYYVMEATGPYFILHSFESAVAEFNAFLDVYYPVKIMIPCDVAISNLNLLIKPLKRKKYRL
jgi:hypothetical protein